MSMKHRMEAYQELFKRYRETFIYFWKNKHELDGKLFQEDEANFLPAVLSLQERPISPGVRLTAKVLMALVGIGLLWALLGKMDIVVNASGKVIPSSRTKSIASVEVSAVRAIYVQEGQFVKAGDVLVELDASSADADYLKASRGAVEAGLQMARSAAMMKAIEEQGKPSLPAISNIPDELVGETEAHLRKQGEEFRAKLARLDGEISRYTQNLKLATKRANDYRILAKEHDVSEHAWLEKEQARVDLQGQLSDAKNQRASLIAQTHKESWDAYVDGRKNLSSNKQEAQRAEARSKLLRLTAPVDGTVQQLTVHTVGGVVPAAQQLMMIVPSQSQVEVEAFVESKDIGFIEEGQRASVKIEAFDYTKYGTVPAKIIHVSKDAIVDEKKGLLYSTKVLLDKADINIQGKPTPLLPGMSATVEIKTGDRRIIEYVLSPLVRHQREALSER